MPSTTCPVCKRPAESITVQVQGGKGIRCPHCGDYIVDQTFSAKFGAQLGQHPLIVPTLAFNLRKQQIGGRRGILGDELARRVIGTLVEGERDTALTLPTPDQQVENLVALVAERSPAAGQAIDVTLNDHAAIIGVADEDNLDFVVQAANDAGLVDASGKAFGPRYPLTLTLAGWRAAAELQKGARTARQGFMALEFNHPDLDDFVTKAFVEGARRAGFALKDARMDPEPGHITARIEAEIQRSMFVIADLTHGNRGAYWEAGFAEGAGKPVIYSCRKEKFPSHFDVQQRYHILWEPEHPKEAADLLAAMLRRIFPGEAKLLDS